MQILKAAYYVQGGGISGCAKSNRIGGQRAWAALENSCHCQICKASPNKTSLIHRMNLEGVHAKSLQLCLTLSDPVDCSPPGSSVHGILQARLLEWIAMPSSRGSSQPKDQTHVSYTAGRFCTTEPPGKSLASTFLLLLGKKNNSPGQ